MLSLEDRLLAEVDDLLAEIGRRHRGRPEAERRALLLLALEREQIVSVAYSEEHVTRRIQALAVPEGVRDIIRHGLLWPGPRSSCTPSTSAACCCGPGGRRRPR